MPYITREKRFELRGRYPENPGELNYLLTEIVVKYLAANKLSYRSINDIIGALEGCKLEFYRRIAIAYEAEKIKENGDVY